MEQEALKCMKKAGIWVFTIDPWGGESLLC